MIVFFWFFPRLDDIVSHWYLSSSIYNGRERKKWVSIEELIQLLDAYLVYVSHELINRKLAIHVSSNRVTANCPYCGKVNH